MKSNRFLKTYVAPSLKCSSLVMEQGIAAGSAQVQFNGTTDQTTPDIEGWKDGGSYNGDIEI